MPLSETPAEARSRRKAPPLALPAHVRSGWTTREGVRLHHLVVAGGPVPLIVVPGITSPAVTWRFAVEPLRDQATAYLLDLRGRGLSDAPSNGYTEDDLADDLEATIEALGLDSPPVVLGHALGARVVARWAGRDAARGSTILIDPPATGPSGPAYVTPLAAFEQMLAQGVRGTTTEEVAALFPDWPERELELRAAWVGTCDLGAVRAGWQEMHTHAFGDLWAAVPPPTLLVRGATSRAITADDLESLGRLNGAGETATVAGAGHMVPWNDLDGFVSLVRPFLLRHLASGARGHE